jgi:hypothetical protein
MTVITTPTIVYRHGDAVPGERIRKILVYDDCTSQPNWSVENPDNSDLPETHQSVRRKIEPERAGPTGAVRPRDCPPDPVSRVLNSVFVRTLREERAALIKAGRANYLRQIKIFRKGLTRVDPERQKDSPIRARTVQKRH